ncbi:MAG: LamG domain-containing protein [Saprospiraceae bacterium]
MKNIMLLLLMGGMAALLPAQTPCDNRCLNFDGKDDYVQLTKSPVQGNVNFTIEGWFRSADNDGLSDCPGGNFERIIGCGGSRLEIGECAGKFGIFSTPIGYVSSGITTGDGKWHYFALTKDGDAIRVFLDGNMVLAHNLPTGTAFSLDNTFRIGRWAGGGTSPENWQGDIDEIRIWDTALPETTLWANNTCKLSGKEAGLLAYYNFDQGVPAGNNTTSKNILTDLSIANNTGTLYGFALTGSLSNWICSGASVGAFCNDPAKDSPLLVSPENMSTFRLGGPPLPNFSWKWNGVQPGPGTYRLEVFRYEKDAPRLIFGQAVAGTSATPTKVFGTKPLVAGIYEWRVTDTISGRQSPSSFFTLIPASCGSITYTIKLDCKDWTSNGLPVYNVTFTLTNTPTSGTAGCKATYSSFLVPFGGGTISGISPSLPKDVLPNSSQTFTFTFIPATLTQTNITVLCNGIWDDGNGNTVNFPAIAALPPCICKDCKEGGILAAVSTVTPGTAPGVFNLSGNVTTTMPGPITAVEFQVQSVTFSATPTSCSKGVTSVESSGVFMNPASAINGSPALIFFNETISTGAPPTNNNVAKDIKWIGNLPANSTVPFNLTLGLPAPLPGLNADCCKMKYRVCIKATIWYSSPTGQGACRACSVVFCKDLP